MDEYLEVLARPRIVRLVARNIASPVAALSEQQKLDRALLRIHSFLDELTASPRTAWFRPAGRLAVIADEPDNRLLELTSAARADFLITGNTNDFALPEYAGARILTPAAFLELAG